MGSERSGKTVRRKGIRGKEEERKVGEKEGEKFPTFLVSLS